MSIINQRRKVKLLLWLSGFLTAAAAYVSMVLLLEVDPGTWLAEIRPGKEASLAAIPVAAAPLQKGAILAEEDIGQGTAAAGFMEEAADMDFTGRVLRVDLPAGMPLAESFFLPGEAPEDDVRIVECDEIELPESLQNGDHVDIRIVFPSGENQVVLAKKVVEQFRRTETETGEKVWLKLDEKEIRRLSEAAAEVRGEAKARLYMTAYVEPEVQQASIPTFEEAAWQ